MVGQHTGWGLRGGSRKDRRAAAGAGFLDAFVHLGDGTTRMKDLPTSVVALLVSEACNIGLAPVVNPGYEALTRSRLVHVDQYYLRADTIAAANAALIATQADVTVVKFWGDGLLASTDCGSSFPSARSARRRRRSTSGSSAASPGSTPSTTRSRASGRWSCPAPRATPCTSWTRC
jgi:Tn3 transposase DDE domain-containing protein